MDAFMYVFIDICTSVSWWWGGMEVMARNTPSVPLDVAAEVLVLRHGSGVAEGRGGNPPRTWEGSRRAPCGRARGGKGPHHLPGTRRWYKRG